MTDSEDSQELNKKNKPKPLRLLTDQALGEGDLAADLENHDGLDFNIYAEILGDAALDSSPLTIGVFGEWGSGKTSLMRMIENHLKKKKWQDLVVVWFNAWRYEQERYPIVPLIASIVKELERAKREREKREEQEDKKQGDNFVDKARDQWKDKWNLLMRGLRAAAYGFSARAKIQVPGFAEVEAGFVAKDMIDRERSLTPDPLLDRSLYYEAFERLSEIAGKPGQDDEGPKIVVLVDDLDRCFPNRAIRLLESIKLVLAQPGFVFILGVAHKVIEGYLENRYREEYGIADFKGHSYLDKIIQLPFHVPSRRDHIKKFARKKMENAGLDPEHEPWSLVLPVIAITFGNNPRTVVRFINTLLIKQMVSKADETRTIPLEFLAVTSCLQQRWPDGLEKLWQSPSLCEKVARYCREKKGEDSQDEESKTAMNDAKQFIAGDNSLKILLTSDAGQKWLDESKIRAATIEFFRREQRLEPTGEQDQPLADENTRLQWELADEQMARLFRNLPVWENKLAMKFVEIPAGEFIMGSSNERDDEKPPHLVTISKPFALGVYPVTQKEWKKVMGTNPSYFEGEDNPVENVSREKAQEFIERLNELDDERQYRLPTEAEWEYACRAGSITEYFFGDHASQLWRFAWYSQNSGGMTNPVGQKESNPWGLYDMLGNVWEWVEDDYDFGYYQTCIDSEEYKTKGYVTDPPGPTGVGRPHVARGGGWNSVAKRTRPAYRDVGQPGWRYDYAGFRLACSSKQSGQVEPSQE